MSNVDTTLIEQLSRLQKEYNIQSYKNLVRVARLEETKDLIQISKNCLRGQLITSLDEIYDLAINKESIYCDCCWGLRPAAVIIMMQFYQVNRVLKEGKLYKVINLKKLKENDNSN